MLDFAQARRNMIDGQLRTYDVNDIPVLNVMGALPRDRFVAPGHEGFAYSDQDTPVSDGVDGAERRLMLKPMVTGRMIQMLGVVAGSKALDVAGGLGYTAAILARLGARVTALESSEAMARAARQRLADCGIEGADAVAGPLERGWPDGAPYEVILLNGLVEGRPQALLDQLADGGRLACLERVGSARRAMLYVRSGDAFGARSVFDAAGPTLPAFRAEPGFVF
jgi:protein-L-isoaspartate(D-aspartate) O-methyltransferase